MTRRGPSPVEGASRPPTKASRVRALPVQPKDRFSETPKPAAGRDAHPTRNCRPFALRWDFEDGTDLRLLRDSPPRTFWW